MSEVYEMRIWNKYTYGHKTYERKNPEELKKILDELIVEGEVKIYKVEEMKFNWEYEKYNPSKIKLTDRQHKELYENGCTKKEKSK